jgi:hypothetical protein
MHFSFSARLNLSHNALAYNRIFRLIHSEGRVKNNLALHLINFINARYYLLDFIICVITLNAHFFIYTIIIIQK